MNLQYTHFPLTISTKISYHHHNTKKSVIHFTDYKIIRNLDNAK